MILKNNLWQAACCSLCQGFLNDDENMPLKNGIDIWRAGWDNE